MLAQKTHHLGAFVELWPNQKTWVFRGTNVGRAHTQIWPFMAKQKKRASEETLVLQRFGRREWDRTTDHHHVKVVLYH